MWCGSLRVSEVLSRVKSFDSFDPITTLCAEDVELEREMVGTEEKSKIRLLIKSPKERRIGTGVKLEIFENGTFCCPVNAWNKWKRRVNLNNGFPSFKENNNS